MNTAPVFTAEVIKLHNNQASNMPSNTLRISDKFQWAWSQKTGNATYKLVLVALAEHASKDLLAWPSISALEAETELNRKTVMKALAALRLMGLIEDTGHRTGVTRQVVVFKLRLDLNAEKESVKASNSTNFGTNNSTNFGTGNDTNLGTVKTVKTVPNFPETVPNFPVNSAKNDSKQSQYWYTESLEPLIEPLIEPLVAENSLSHSAAQPAPKKEISTSKPASSEQTEINRQVWATYSQAYQQRYQVQPVRNAKVNKQIADLVKSIGRDAVQVAAWFVSHSNSYYIQRGHSIGVLLADCEKLRTEWATGRTVSAQTARQLDKTSANAESLAIAQQLIRQRYGKQEDAQ